MKKINFVSLVIVLALAFVAFSVVRAAGTWRDAPSNPPGNNADAPINVSDKTQMKSGSLAIGNILQVVRKLLVGSGSAEEALDVKSGNTVLSKYLYLRDYDSGQKGPVVVYSRDNTFQFAGGGVSVGSWTNGATPAFVSTTGNLVVSNKVGSAKYCDVNGQNCFTAAQVISLLGGTPSDCTPLSSQTRSVACPAGQTGSRTEMRTSSCPGPVWSTWNEISNSCVTPGTPTCTSFTYSAWTPAICPVNGTQTRTVSTRTPTGCTGGNPVTTQTCTYTPPAPAPVDVTWYSDSAPVNPTDGGSIKCADGSAMTGVDVINHAVWEAWSIQCSKLGTRQGKQYPNSPGALNVPTDWDTGWLSGDAQAACPAGEVVTGVDGRAGAIPTFPTGWKVYCGQVNGGSATITNAWSSPMVDLGLNQGHSAGLLKCSEGGSNMVMTGIGRSGNNWQIHCSTITVP